MDKRKKEYMNVRKERSERCKERRTSLVPVLSGVLLVLLSLFFSGKVGFIIISFASGFLNVTFKALFGRLATNPCTATPFPGNLPSIPGIPVERFLVCCGNVATFSGTFVFIGCSILDLGT